MRSFLARSTSRLVESGTEEGLDWEEKKIIQNHKRTSIVTTDDQTRRQHGEMVRYGEPVGVVGDRSVYSWNKTCVFLDESQFDAILTRAQGNHKCFITGQTR